MPTDEQILNDAFEYERCSNCGGDADDHVVVPGPFDEPHVVCKSEL